MPRVLGRYSADLAGPTVLVVGGIHGNEPSGVKAAQRVLEWLHRHQPRLRGEFIALAGNVKALARGERFIERDLNRAWDADRIDRLRKLEPATDGAEDAEVRELLGLIDGYIESARGPVLMLDLHTTSGDGPPFTVMSDTLRNRPIAFAMPVPVILGLEESVDGTLVEYIVELGHVALAVETGRHDDPRSVDRHEAVIWLALASTNALSRAEGPGFEPQRRLLAQATTGAPKVVELMYRHDVKPDHDFVMEPGFRGFMPVHKGDLLARDRLGDVRSPRSGRILMPLYQAQGSDGFFITRTVPDLWLKASRRARKLHLERLLSGLVGVRRHPSLTDALVVHPHVAKRTLELFHLLGYRKKRYEGHKLVFSRRRHH